jgi:hypothetical protein
MTKPIYTASRTMWAQIRQTLKVNPDRAMNETHLGRGQ